MNYDFKKIENKWQTNWDNNKTFDSFINKDKEKYYILVEFPYPSGAGLHVGHVRSYTALDAVARKRRMEGFNVLFPMGWDAFGSPAEQYAIKHNVHPSIAVIENIKTFKNQIKNLGISFNWNREINTSSPEYYKWTQWQFLRFFEHNMAYKAKKNINWCPSCKSGLSNEEASGGVCERCGTNVIQKEKEQWVLKMSDYAEDLLDGLNNTKFHDRIKLGQINWIGKSIGAEVEFLLTDSNKKLKVFTTRVDTIYGVTFVVVAPEHPILREFKESINNYDEVKNYQESIKIKTEFERIELNKDKTGVKLDGLMAINPVTKENIPIFVADYVMMNYGTGAIMAVPAHDERDFDFAKKFNVEIKPIIESENLPYIGDGKYINSLLINGLTNKDKAISIMIDFVEKNNIGTKKVNYRLQDWVFSRQRFWGEPIPIINCPECGYVPVPESDLPVVLPNVVNFEPNENGESPLANITEWVNVKCPKCGKDAKRETDTMPNWAGSSWYFLRYMDSHNNEEFVSKENLNYWGKVDWYNGGMEHTTRHLLYARFWNQFLYNIGLVPNKEPFNVRVSHGMILGNNGIKMSKSLGNVVNPDDVVNNYGADALRVYEMFIGDYEKDASWSTDSLNGCKRFLEKVWKLQNKLNEKDGYTDDILVNKTIKKVSYDIDNMKYNTIVSALMILANNYDKYDTISKADYRILLHLLNPIAPHITEELNELCALGKPFTESIWPSYDESKTIEDQITIGVQINGKLRSQINVKKDEEKESIEKRVLEDNAVKNNIFGKEIIKIIIIPNRIVNIVVK